MHFNTATAACAAGPGQDTCRISDAFVLPEPGRVAHGAAEVVSVRAVLERGDRARRILRRLCDLGAKAPLCLHPRDLPAGQKGLVAWSRFCERVYETAARIGIPMRALATCIHSHHLPLSGFHAATDDVFGAGDRFVFLDSLQMQCHRNERVTMVSDRNWTYLWRGSREPGPVMPVYGGFVRSTCPLLAEEVAITVLPDLGLLSPQHSAWLPVKLDVSALAAADGDIDDTQLRAVVECALGEAESCFDDVEWPGRRRQADARLNRRIALTVTGVGDIVHQSGADPAEFRCLQSMQRLLGRIRTSLDDTSASLARQLGEVPSLSRACPPLCGFAGSHGETWLSRFDEARRDAAVRHRNLLVLSPYSVLPRTDRIDPAYIDLLPLIGVADAWVFADPPRLDGWNVTQFKHFHQRARAVIQASQGPARIAAGV